MKKTMKLMLHMFLTCVLLCTCVLSSFAETGGITPRWTNTSDTTMSFTVVDGEAFFYVSYEAREDTFLQAKLTVQIQKKVLGLFWKDVADEWVGYSTDVGGYFYDYIPINGTGTYQAIFKLTIYGNQGIADVIEDTIDVKYT